MEGFNKRLYTAAAARIVRGKKVILESAVGQLDPKNEKNETQLDSMFDLASLTKVFTATAFMKMVEMNQIGLDNFVSEIVPEFSDGKKKKVTFRHLLSHSSGLPASFNLYEKQEWNKGNEVVMNKLFNVPLILTPGFQAVYSCLGFMLLGYAMEKITGNRLDKIFNDVLFKPLKWQGVLFKPPMEYAKKIAVTTYTRPNRGTLTPGIVHDGNAIALHNGIAGNAGLFGIAKSVSFLGEIFLNKSFLSAQTIGQMISLQAESDSEKMGIGWKLHSINNSCPGSSLSSGSFGHTGFTGTSLWVDPKNQLVLTLLTNSVHYYNNDYGPKEFMNFRREFHQCALDSILRDQY